ncbi:hypothetical protein X759_35605 [Mesorhizobium sp. LSHC420B00]|nr:hypothetical protein X759_35605 [Mesorhizobium sp. LSHC420B00]
MGIAGSCCNFRLSFSVQDDDCSLTHLQKRREDVHDIGERNLQLAGGGQHLRYLVESPERDICLGHAFDGRFRAGIPRSYLVDPILRYVSHGNTSGVVVQSALPFESEF